MRPIQNAPIPTRNGVVKSFTNYQEWRRDLYDAYGQHCVYCNDRLPNNLQVEHQVAQSLGTINPLDWNNLYLACGPCNLAKSNIAITALTHYIPNEHNTHLIFDYQVRLHRKLKGKMACIPIVKPNLNAGQFVKALNIIRDLKLDKVEQPALQERKMTDVRWQNRFDAFELAKTQRKLWDSLNSQAQQDEFLLCIPPMLIKAGFFSLWLNAFHNIPELLRVIIQALPNTAQNCFDSTGGYLPIPRNPLNAADPI